MDKCKIQASRATGNDPSVSRIQKLSSNLQQGLLVVHNKDPADLAYRLGRFMNIYWKMRRTYVQQEVKWIV